jgi:xylulokinase
VERHGFRPTTKVIAWSGDNPSSLIGVGLVKPGRIAISLGTSDTLFGFLPMPRVDPMGVGHVFGSPTGDFMSLICFKNGSLARERVRNAFRMDWEAFSRALRESKPGNGGGIMLPWFDPEITPTVLEPGARTYGVDLKSGPVNVRAVVEGQMLSTAIHSQWMGVKVDTIHATGGAAKNREILQVMANVHDAQVYQFEVGNSASLGAALRAYHADLLSEGRKLPWEEIVAGFTEPVAESRISPDPDVAPIYAELKKVYSACESHALRGGDDPMPLIEAFRKSHG